MKLAIALLVAFLVGAGCRFFDIPAPAPPALTGALLVFAMSLGYVVVDRWKAPSPPPAAVRPQD